MFYPIYKAFEWVAEGVPKKALESKKRGANPDFSFFSWGIGSYMLFRLAKSNGVEHSHKCPNQTQMMPPSRSSLINSSYIKHQ